MSANNAGPLVTNVPLVPKAPMHMVLGLCQHLSRQDHSPLLRACRSLATGVCQQDFSMNDITSHEDIDLECAIAWADDKLFAEAMRNGADLSRGLSSYRDGSGFGMKLEVHQRPLALAISKSQYDVAISLLEHHAPRLSLNSWAEGYIISFLPFPSHQGLRSELCLFTCLLYEFHQDQGRQTDELLHAREKFLDALLLHIQPQTCGETNRCVECHACLASATAVPYSIFAKLVTGAVDPTTKNTNFVPVGPLSVTCWQMQIFNDATVKDGHPAMSQQMCKFCRFVSMLPVEEAASTRKQILFFIIKFLLAPEAHLNKAHGSANIEMHETVKTSRFDLLFGHLSTLFDTYDDLNIDMRWQDTPDTLLQYAARSVRLRNTIIPPEDQREPPAEVFHIPYPHDPKATGVNMGALAVCSFLLKNGYDAAAPLVRMVLRDHNRPRNGSHLGDLENQTDDTALHMACRAAHPSAAVIRELMSYGFDTSVRNRDGKTPLQVLRAERHHSPRVKAAIRKVLLGK